MATESVTYTGPLGAGAVRLPSGGSVPFRRGVPVDMSAEDAQALAADPDWTAEPTTAAPAEPTPTTAPAEQEQNQ